MLRVLRLMCLQSMCCGGFRKYDDFRREILQTYGYEYVFSLDNLEKILLDKLQFIILLPFKYRLAINKSNFFFLKISIFFFNSFGS